MPIHLDFETYSEVAINKVGAWRYSVDDTTEVICAAIWDSETDEDSCELLTDPYKIERRLREVVNAASPNNRIFAWNSFFEMAICANVLLIPEALNPEIWDDTAAAAAAAALPRSLDGAGAALGLSPDKAKLKEGKQLIQKLCKPNRGTRNRDELTLEKLYEYCKRDVLAESEIQKLIPPLTSDERKVWELDQRINLRGLRVDAKAVSLLNEVVDMSVEATNEEIKDYTKGALETVSSRKQVMDYLYDVGYPITSYAAAAVDEYLKDPKLPEEARKIFEARKKTGKTSTAKYKSLLTIKDPSDHRIRGVLRYHGAATGRWSGALFQPQNLARPAYRNMAPAVSLLADSTPQEFMNWADLLYGCPMEVCSSLVRSMIIPSYGKTFVVADYDQIEARVLCWLSGQEDVLDVFRGSGLVYEMQAANIYHTKTENITKDDPRRQIGKVAVLALGFGGGAGAFVNMASIYNIDVSEAEAEQIKTTWRDTNTHTVKFWWALDKAAIEAVGNPGRVTSVRGIKFKVINKTLFCKLPSGRYLAYQRPRIATGKFGNDQVVYMGIDSTRGARHWSEVQMYGGKWAQNITQATARDIMAAGMLEAERWGYEIVLTVHDEVIAETEHGSIEGFEQILSTPPKWAKGLPLGVGGKAMERYGKL